MTIPEGGCQIFKGPSAYLRDRPDRRSSLSSALEHIVTASDPGFSDWQWRLSTLPFAFRGLGAYSACDVLNYAFLAAFNAKMEIDLLSNPSQVVALKLMKKLADIYFTRVTQMVESTFSQSTRQMALWKSQMEDHTSDWLRVVLISGVFAGDIYGDHVVSCDGIVSIKHRYNLVRDTLVDICFRYGISVGKEVDVGLGGGRDKPLRPTDMLLYSWFEGLDVCVDLTGSSPLTPHGRMILASVEKGPLVWPTITVDGVTRPKVYTELTPVETIQADCDIKAINIILQGLPTKIYALVSQHRVAKDIWEKIKLLMKGTSLKKQERECKLYDEFDKFTYKKESRYTSTT
ncbi:hypothetical protein Tco_0915988 [Tanacetum coccineum]